MENKRNNSEVHGEHNDASGIDEEDDALEAEVSLEDRNRMQIALARRMNLGIKDWIVAYSETFSELLKDSPELASGFADLEPEGKSALAMLDAMIEELEGSIGREAA